MYSKEKIRTAKKQFLFFELSCYSRDLLSTDSGNKLEVKMKPEGGGYYVPGLQTVEVHTVQDINQVSHCILLMETGP